MASAVGDRRPCECGALLDDLPDDVSHCWCHHVNEPIPADAYRVCGECGHVYPTAQSLVDAYNREVESVDRRHADALGISTARARLDQVDEIFFCQECIHDF